MGRIHGYGLRLWVEMLLPEKLSLSPTICLEGEEGNRALFRPDFKSIFSGLYRKKTFIGMPKAFTVVGKVSRERDYAKARGRWI
jgi:hypothetical protein